MSLVWKITNINSQVETNLQQERKTIYTLYGNTQMVSTEEPSSYRLNNILNGIDVVTMSKCLSWQ